MLCWTLPRHDTVGPVRTAGGRDSLPTKCVNCENKLSRHQPFYFLGFRINTSVDSEHIWTLFVYSFAFFIFFSLVRWIFVLEFKIALQTILTMKKLDHRSSHGVCSVYIFASTLLKISLSVNCLNYSCLITTVGNLKSLSTNPLLSFCSFFFSGTAFLTFRLPGKTTPLRIMCTGIGRTFSCFCSSCSAAVSLWMTSF